MTSKELENIKFIDEVKGLLNSSAELFEVLENYLPYEDEFRLNLLSQVEKLKEYSQKLDSNKNRYELIALQNNVKIVTRRVMSGKWTLRDMLIEILDSTDGALTTDDFFNHVSSENPTITYDRRRMIKKISATLSALYAKDDRLIREKRGNGFLYRKK